MIFLNIFAQNIDCGYKLEPTCFPDVSSQGEIKDGTFSIMDN